MRKERGREDEMNKQNCKHTQQTNENEKRVFVFRLGFLNYLGKAIHLMEKETSRRKRK